MSTPSDSTADVVQQAAAGSPADAEADGMADIPRRPMRVKVLYTFDDQNKSNCLARLPNALSIPTVSLDETTQVGVIELKTCIQAIVAASPELVAKLGHDYTVYAFDYSEYETPLVGQGMLSWILASASMTPNAPAEQSQTMVTGRVCKNILGLFSNGIKETLEVKLKLVPVPTCMQSEYVENMERYHNLSKVLPEGLPDYKAWAQFLEANPAIRQLAQPTPINPAMSIEPSHMGGLDSMHQMLARQSPSENATRFDSFQDQHMLFNNTYDTRASSPAMSTASFYQYPFHQDARPDSRASFHSDSAFTQYFSTTETFQDQQDQQEQEEEGPPKKRARVTQARRPRKSVLGASNDSLRVTASTAASVRLHKPAAGHAGAAVSIEQVPRAPTPRPGNVGMPLARGAPRPVAPSLLRHASVDAGQTYVSPYEPGLFSDVAQDSADEGQGCSPGDTPLNMPSSPPVMRTASSSPDLPSLPLLNDSGFVSDILGSREDEDKPANSKSWAESELPVNVEEHGATKPNVSHARSQSVQSIPENTANASQAQVAASITIEETLLQSFRSDAEPSHSTYRKATPMDSRRHSHSTQGPRPTNALARTESAPPNGQITHSVVPNNTSANARSPDAICPPTTANNAPAKISGGANNLASLAKKPRPAKPRGLERSQTWSGEPMSDVACPPDGKTQPRSGSGAKRRHVIKHQLEEALGSGKMPQYCNHCGQIETPAWRKAYTRIEYGSPEGIQLSSKGTAICALELMLPEEGENGAQRYRIFKQNLTLDETESATFTTLILCNPCGLWLGKRNCMRPQEVWVKAHAQAAAVANGEKPKRKRKPRKPKGDNNDTMSDAVIPDSECAQPDAQDAAQGPTALDGTADTYVLGSNTRLQQKPSSNSNATEDAPLDRTAAEEALLRAIQSSPAGLRGTKDSPIELGEDLTPKPTRRILFPSPHRSGETKSLGDIRSVPSIKKPDSSLKSGEGTTPVPSLDLEEVDKENCPPASEEDGLSHLFDDIGSAKTTPTKSRSLEDMLKTPTPASRRRVPLTPKRGGDVLGLTTPSRVVKTPRTAMRAATVAPETPFTRQLNALLSDCMASSPSQAIDFSAFPTFNTPGRTTDSGTNFGDFLSNDFLSSDLPIPSSPNGGLNFSVFEDPTTSTVGLWSGASIFETNGAITGDLLQSENESRRASEASAGFKMTDMSMDFSALLEGVVGNSDLADEIPAQAATVVAETLVIATDTSEKANGTTTREVADQKQSDGTPGRSPCGVGSATTEGTKTVEASARSDEKTKTPTTEATVSGTTTATEVQPRSFAQDTAIPDNAKEAGTLVSQTDSKEQPGSPLFVDQPIVRQKSKSPVVAGPAPTRQASTPEVRVKVELVGHDDSP